MYLYLYLYTVIRTFPSTAVTGLTQSAPFIASPSRAALKNKNPYLPGHAVTPAVLWVTMKEAHSISNIYILEGWNFRRRLLKNNQTPGSKL